jgi:hypothetical protein
MWPTAGFCRKKFASCDSNFNINSRFHTRIFLSFVVSKEVNYIFSKFVDILAVGNLDDDMHTHIHAYMYVDNEDATNVVVLLMLLIFRNYLHNFFQTSSGLYTYIHM